MKSPNSLDYSKGGVFYYVRLARGIRVTQDVLDAAGQAIRANASLIFGEADSRKVIDLQKVLSEAA